MKTSQSIAIPREYFVKERRELYADWILAFWREMFQNSLDAGARKIRIGLETVSGVSGQPTVRITFLDNGKGMSRDTLEQVFFRLGSSTKNADTTTIGGFGRARLLTCFSMANYAIRTGNLAVSGSGAQYRINQISAADGPVNGCAFIIDCDEASLEQLEDGLRRFMAKSRLEAQVFYNKSEVVAQLSRGKSVRDLQRPDDSTPFARVYSNKSGPFQERVIVSVNGAIMFERLVRHAPQIVVDLDPSQARQVLTANRDGLSQAYQGAIDAFLQEVAIDPKSAVRDRRRRYNGVYRGSGSTLVNAGLRDVSAETDGEEVVQQDQAMQEQAKLAAAREPELSVISAGRLPGGMKDLFLLDESEESEVYRAIPAWLPDNWQLHGDRRTGLGAFRLAVLWHAALEEAIKAWLQVTGAPRMAFDIGWGFMNEEARCDIRSGRPIFYLNPVTADGKTRYPRLSEKDTWRKLMAVAKHETAHLSVAWHSEVYAQILTGIDKIFDQRQAQQGMEAALAAAEARLGTSPANIRQAALAEMVA